ncbi:hypothetical protein KXD40_000712 [Peronospora effusa]|nr:hypothetical protein KXD40_000712 [Peronospora effusa]
MWVTSILYYVVYIESAVTAAISCQIVDMTPPNKHVAIIPEGSMERKRPVGTAADPPSLALHMGPLTDVVATSRTVSNEQNNLPPPPQSFGFPAPVNTNTNVATRGWRPGRVGGRHDSPLYGKNRKRPSSSSIDSNVSWSGSEIESISGNSAAHSEQEQVTRLSWASSAVTREEVTSTGHKKDLTSAATLFRHVAIDSTGTSAKEVDVPSPKTPHADNCVDSRTNSTDNVFAATSSIVYDEEKNGPQSCPLMFNNTRQPQFSIEKLHQLRNNELIPSKFLPTRTSVDSLMGYVRELQLSEATLRKQLLKNKQHTEEELTHTLSKVNELERTVQEAERDRELARRKLAEQEQLIRDLAAKLKQAEAFKSKGTAVPAVNELSPIAEEATVQTEIDTSALTAETNEHPDIFPPAPTPAMQQQQPSISLAHRDQPKEDNSGTQFGLASPRSPDRPLWDPWVAGGTNPTKNLPPVFTIGSTGLDPAVSLSTPSSPTSMSNPTTPTVGKYELKSVLLSPREKQNQIEASGNGKYAQHEEQNTTTAPPDTQQEKQNPAAIFDMGPRPPPLDSHQQAFASSGTPSAAHGVQSVDPLVKSSSQDVPMTISANENLLERKHSVTGSNGLQGQQWPSATSTPSFVSAEAASIGEMVLPPSSSFAVASSQASVKNAQFQYDESEVATGSSGDTQVAQPEQESDFVAEDVATGVRSVLPSGSSPPVAPAISEIQAPSPASAQIESAADPAEPVSLETLLVDFFTEVDNKRLKMAKVYGKRYAGREKWLFAELSKRYGAAKVAALKVRFDDGSDGSTSAVTNHCKSSNDPHASNSSNVSTHAKAGRQVHPRHPHFVHPPTPASNVDLSAGTGVSSVASPVAPFQEKDESRSQIRQVAEEINTGSSPSKQSSANSIPPHKCPTGSNISSLSGPPPSLPTLQETGEGDNATAVGTDGATFRSGPARRTRHGEPTSHFNQLPSRPQTENSNTPPVGLRQRHQLSAGSQTSTGVERPDVTLEGLLKELYKTHQPDKLKNVSIVAKQYAGRERELVGLLKGKYGVLSVKRLEENLDSLERTHRAHMSKSGTRKKRGCFVRTVSLVFWFTVLLNFSFGAVFVSFVVLNAWGCRSFDSEEQELEAAGDCLPLKKELETFTYERIATYVVQSHPDACFCSEWKARESALFDTFSGEDLVKVARLVAFSPVSFGVPWIAIVKEQVPSQTFYDSYAKPVVDLSLDAGIFAWSSVLELAGYIEVSAMSTAVKNAVDNYFGETAEVDNERFADNVNADALPIEEAQVVDGEAVAVAPGLLEQVLVKEELDTFDENRKTDSLETSDRATGLTDNVLMEDDVSEGMTTASEEGFSLLSETDGEELATVESVNVLELEDVAPVEVAESIDAGEQDSFDEAEGEETWTDASIPAEEAESAADADDGTSAFTETEEEDVATTKTSFNDIEAYEAESVFDTDEGTSAFIETEEEDVDVENTFFNDIEEVSEAESVFGTDEGTSAFIETEEEDVDVENTFFNDIEEVSEAESIFGTDEGVSAFTETEEGDIDVENTSYNDIEKVAEAAVEVEVNEEMSAEDVITVSEGVVEVEVRQDGIELSYAKSEMDEALTAESAESSILSVDKESDLLFGGGDEPSALSDETEVVEAKDASDDVFVGAAEEDIAPVMEGVGEDFAAPTSSAIEADVEVTNLGSDIATTSEVVEIEAENIEKEPTDPEVLQMMPPYALSSEFSLVFEDSESSNITSIENIEELALMLAGEEIAANLLSEGPESEAGKELDDLTKAEAQETETTSDKKEGVPSEEDDANMLAEEGFIVAKPEREPDFSSNDIDAEVILAEEGTVRSSDDEYMTIKEEGDDDNEELVAPAEMEELILHNGDDENMFEEKSDEADDEIVIRAEVEVASELEVEEYYGGVPSENIVAPELTDDLENQDYDLKGSVEEAVSAEIEAVGERSNLLSEVEVENLEDVPIEMDKVGAESTASDEIEVMQFVSEVDPGHELGEGIVVDFEDAVGSDDENTVSVEHPDEVNEDIGDTEAVDSSLTKVDSPIADEAMSSEDGPIAGDVENVGIAEDETHISDEVEAATLEAATVTHQMDAIGDPEVSHADGTTVVDGETSELQQAVDESSAPAIEEGASDGFASAVNEVLARLVEPFEAAKTAAM